MMDDDIGIGQQHPNLFFFQSLSASISLPETSLSSSSSSLDNDDTDDVPNHHHLVYKTWGQRDDEQPDLIRGRMQDHAPVSWKPSGLGGQNDDASATRAFTILNTAKYLDPDHIGTQRRASGMI